ncbi:MAG TPA: HDOD domain-containing protein [Burkholderiaceae bacterium]|nr:HDOD domain-containing protein [Burkholderiaceae bacterium]
MTASDHTPATKRSAPAQPAASPSFGRFKLQRLLGKSAHTLIWLASDPQVDAERVLVMPHTQARDAAELQRHLQAARKAMRVTHPGLAAAVEVGEHDRWPYAAYERGESNTLIELTSSQGSPALDVARWSMQVLDGLAFAHEAGLAHRDIQPAMVSIDGGRARLMGLEIAPAPAGQATAAADPAHPVTGLQAQRRDSERDVLAFGLVLHYALTGQHALDQLDIGSAMALMPPRGREIVRVPWTTARPIPEALRVIANRATDRQQRHRYHSARTLARALEGWIRAEEATDGGPLALLIDRLRSIGALPSLPDAAKRAARLALMERERTIELAEIVLQDPALCFELLRAVNTAEVRGAMIAGSGPVLTMRRAIAMVGLDGVRRAALSLRDWPGPLGSGAAKQLEAAIARAQRAARIAQLLRPPGYDAEVVYLVALLQGLGRLVTCYHFPEEAAQIRRLMQPASAEQEGQADEPGMTEEGASLAVLGVEIEALGSAVARHWGLDESVLHMIRRFGLASAVRTLENDDDMLRATASCANELVDALSLPAHHSAAALQRVAQRYGRALGMTLRDLQLAAQGESPHDDGGDDDRGEPNSARHAV